MAKKYIEKGGILADMRLRLIHMAERPAPPEDEDYARGVRAGFELGINWVSSCEPAANVREDVRGEWKHLGGDEWCCPACGHVISTEGSWEHPHERGAFCCENCGKNLRGAEDGGDYDGKD